MTQAGKPIYPSELSEPFTLAQMHDMVQSWKGKGYGRSEVPVEVRMVSWMFAQMEKALHDVQRFESYVDTMEAEVKREHLELLAKLDVLRGQMQIANIPVYLLMDHVREQNKAPPKRESTTATR